jgi:hypothetical protein
MATLTRNFGFNDNAGVYDLDSGRWVGVVGGGTNVTFSGTTQADSPNDPGGPPPYTTDGCWQANRFGKNLSNGTPYYEWTGTYQDLGVPAGSTISAVNLSYDWECQSYAIGAASSFGPAELRDSSGTSILATFSAAITTITAVTTWATSTGTTASGRSDAAATTIKLRIGVNPKTGNSNSASVTLILDWVVVTVTYTAGGPATSDPLALYTERHNPRRRVTYR